MMYDDLIKFEYEFLKGDNETWPDSIKGMAAWNVVSSFCNHKNYGTFGQPTSTGQKAIEAYELRQNER